MKPNPKHLWYTKNVNLNIFTKLAEKDGGYIIRDIVTAEHPIPYIAELGEKRIVSCVFEARNLSPEHWEFYGYAPPDNLGGKYL